MYALSITRDHGLDLQVSSFSILGTPNVSLPSLTTIIVLRELRGGRLPGPLMLPPASSDSMGQLDRKDV